MVDRERILGKIALLENYLGELKTVVPISFKEYQRVEKKRSCERLLQLSIEVLIDICKLIVAGKKLGIPAEENDLFNKLEAHKLLPMDVISKLQDMRAFRNILVHEYATVDDEIVYEKAKKRLKDFEEIKQALLKAVKNNC